MAACTQDHPEQPVVDEVASLPPVSEIEPPQTLSLTFVGDIMAHRPNFSMSGYHRIYQHVEYLFANSDLVFGNLEFAVDADHPYQTYPLFNVQPDYVQAAIDAGITVFSLANNHTTDRFRAGTQKTLESMDMLARRAQLAGREIFYSGIRNAPDGSFEVRTIQHGPWSIGFVALTDFVNEWFGHDLVYIVGFTRELEMNRFIDWLSDRIDDYDLFVVSYHGGAEYVTEPHPRKLQLMRRLVDAGVDVVWGHHPHVLQPWEVRVRQDGTEGVILASLGNFVSGQTWFLDAHSWDLPRAFTGDSAVVRVTFVEMDDQIRLHLVQPTLISHYIEPDGGVIVLPFSRIFQQLDPNDPWYGYYRRRYEQVLPLVVDARWSTERFADHGIYAE